MQAGLKHTQIKNNYSVTGGGGKLTFGVIWEEKLTVGVIWEEKWAFYQKTWCFMR